MRFSVIIPIFKVEKYLRQCVDSVLCQSFSDFELILVDDGSPDTCPQICDEYEKQDERVKVVHKKNGGLVSARKAGIEIAKGDYCIYVDGDDYVIGEYFCRADELLNKYKSDVLIFGFFQKSNSLKKQKSFLEVGFYDEKRIRYEVYPYLIENECAECIEPVVWNKVIRTDLLREKQILVPDDVIMGEDDLCTKPVLFCSQSIYVTDDAFYCYRKNNESITRCRHPRDLETAKKIGKFFDSVINDKEGSFIEQIYRNIAHRLFNACVSQFNIRNKKQAKRNITSALNDEFYKKAVNNACYSAKCLRGNLMLYALRHKIFFLMRLYNKVNL